MNEVSSLNINSIAVVHFSGLETLCPLGIHPVMSRFYRTEETEACNHPVLEKLGSE